MFYPGILILFALFSYAMGQTNKKEQSLSEWETARIFIKDGTSESIIINTQKNQILHEGSVNRYEFRLFRKIKFLDNRPRFGNCRYSGQDKGDIEVAKWNGDINIIRNCWIVDGRAKGGGFGSISLETGRILIKKYDEILEEYNIKTLKVHNVLSIEFEDSSNNISYNGKHQQDKISLEIENYIPLIIREYYYLDKNSAKHILKENSKREILLDEFDSIGIIVENVSNNPYAEGWSAVFRSNTTHLIGPIRMLKAGNTLPIEVSRVDLGITYPSSFQIYIELSNGTALKSRLIVK